MTGILGIGYTLFVFIEIIATRFLIVLNGAAIKISIVVVIKIVVQAHGKVKPGSYMVPENRQYILAVQFLAIHFIIVFGKRHYLIKLLQVADYFITPVTTTIIKNTAGFAFIYGSMQGCWRNMHLVNLVYITCQQLIIIFKRFRKLGVSCMKLLLNIVALIFNYSVIMTNN